MTGLKRKRAPKMLTETNRRFKEAIKEMSRENAYQFYKKKKGQYKYKTEETVELFREMTGERCSFCTKCISDFDGEMTVEHIRLKRDYPKKIYQWSNLLCSCRTCNTRRGTKPYDKTKYLDPTKIANIEDYFCYNLDGEIRVNEALSEEEQEKADYMIKLYGLKRPELNCKRREFLKNLMEDDDFYQFLSRQDIFSPNIIFWSVFTYYRRSMKRDGE